jgi:non-ribosomal peptide synthetase component F
MELVNLYGPTECTIAATYHRVTRADIDRQIIPIGRPLPNYICHILNDQLTSVPHGTLGELFIGGQGVFAGYLTNDESINTRALVQLPDPKMNGMKFYRSGDLCRLDEQGEIICIGRVDYQVKLRGQRLEVGEIEACIMRTKNVTNCVVTKCTDARSQQDFLAAYVESTSCSKDEIRQQCRDHLPAYMVPSVFVILDRLPLNSNGKVDRKQLPEAEFHDENNVSNEFEEPQTELERQVHNHWCAILNVDRVSMNANFFASGGNSLLLMKLLSVYRTAGLVPPGDINTAYFFEHTTLADHTRHLQPAACASEKNRLQQSTEWIPLNVDEARASAAQERIWLDEQLRFFGPKSQTAIYNIPLPIVIGNSPRHLTVSRLRQALLSVITRHKVLRTRLQHRVEATGGIVKQYVNPISNNVQHATVYSFVESVCKSENELKQALTNEVSGNFFRLDQGLVVRCHLIRRNPTELGHKNLIPGDVIVFNFHHAAFDGASRIPFFQGLENALNKNEKTISNDTHAFQYIDYSIYEWRLLLDDSNSSMIQETRTFWKECLAGCIDNQISLFESQETKEDSASEIFMFNLDKHLVDSFTSLSVSENMSLFQMSLAAYILFLYKITHDQDICVGCVTANRYRSELEDLVGMFVNILPYRIKFGTTTDKLIRVYLNEIRRLCLEVMRHGRFPFQDIVKLHRKPQEQSSRLPFFQTTLDFESSNTFDPTVCTLDGIPCQALDLPVSVAKYDLAFIVKHSISNDGEQNVICSWEYATKAFDKAYIQRLSDRFVVFLSTLVDEQTIDRTSVILPYELAIQRQLNSTYVDFKDRIMCIASNFHRHAMQDPQKTCLILDDKHLTYAEVNEQANVLAQHLLTNCGVRQGHIIMQCVQRSLEMVIGILAILKIQAIYCPLNPADPSERHALLVEDTKAQVILCHTQTRPALQQWTVNQKHLSVVDMTDVLSSKDSHRSENIKFEPNAPENCAYIIYTSGSTGKPKAVPIRHCNFMACILGMEHMKVYQSTDIIAQMTACSYDVHVMELLGCLVTGGTLVMLKPYGNMDMEYIARTFHEKRITWSIVVPTIALSLYEYLHGHPEHAQRLKSLRICISGGKCN